MCFSCLALFLKFFLGLDVFLDVDSGGHERSGVAVVDEKVSDNGGGDEGVIRGWPGRKR